MQPSVTMPFLHMGARFPAQQTQTAFFGSQFYPPSGPTNPNPHGAPFVPFGTMFNAALQTRPYFMTSANYSAIPTTQQQPPQNLAQFPESTSAESPHSTAINISVGQVPQAVPSANLSTPSSRGYEASPGRRESSTTGQRERDQEFVQRLVSKYVPERILVMQYSDRDENENLRGLSDDGGFTEPKKAAPQQAWRAAYWSMGERIASGGGQEFAGNGKLDFQESTVDSAPSEGQGVRTSTELLREEAGGRTATGAQGGKAECGKGGSESVAGEPPALRSVEERLEYLCDSFCEAETAMRLWKRLRELHEMMVCARVDRSFSSFSFSSFVECV